MLDDYTHAFCLTWEREVCQDVILFFFIGGVHYFYEVFITLAHQETYAFGELDQGYLIGAGGLKNSNALIDDWCDIVAEDQGS